MLPETSPTEFPRSRPFPKRGRVRLRIILWMSSSLFCNPEICGGETVIKGTRVTLRTVLASLAEGATVEELAADFPTLSGEDVRAVIAFAAASAEEDLPVPGIPLVT